MQALLHGCTADRILPSTHVALMGPTDRGDAISGIIKGLGVWCLSGPRHRSQAGFPVLRLHLIDQSINSNNQFKPSLKAPAFQRTVLKTNPLTDFFYSNILLCRAPLLS